MKALREQRIGRASAAGDFFCFFVAVLGGLWYFGLLGPSTAGLFTGRRVDILDNGSNTIEIDTTTSTQEDG